MTRQSRFGLTCWPLLTVLLLLTAGAYAQEEKRYPDGHGGHVVFPLGDLSFADEVVSFESGSPGAHGKKKRARNPAEVLGIPNYESGRNYTTLGCGGILVVRFVDNSLIDVEGNDLYVFEIGPDVEPTQLAISRDGEHWTDLGKIAGARADVDIAAFIDGSEPYTYVRLIDGRGHCGGETPGADVDAVGAIGSGFKIQLDSAVLFDTGMATLRPEAKDELQRVLALLAEHRGARVLIDGHTDNVGSDTSNQSLSDRRAKAVKDVIVADASLDLAAISSQGYGEQRPVATNETNEGRQKNRRVEITVIPNPRGVAAVKAPAPEPTPPAANELKTKLVELKQLFEDGLISQEDYDRKRSEVLSEF